MKIRHGFVTNSSSSSYILAVREGATAKEVEPVVRKHFKEAIEQAIDDHGGESEVEYSAESLTKRVVRSILETASNKYGGAMVLEGWVVEAGEASSENGIESYVYYVLGQVDTPILKYK